MWGGSRMESDAPVGASPPGSSGRTPGGLALAVGPPKTSSSLIVGQVERAVGKQRRRCGDHRQVMARVNRAARPWLACQPCEDGTLLDQPLERPEVEMPMAREVPEIDHGQGNKCPLQKPATIGLGCHGEQRRQQCRCPPQLATIDRPALAVEAQRRSRDRLHPLTCQGGVDPRVVVLRAPCFDPSGGRSQERRGLATPDSARE